MKVLKKSNRNLKNAVFNMYATHINSSTKVEAFILAMLDQLVPVNKINFPIHFDINNIT